VRNALFDSMSWRAAASEQSLPGASRAMLRRASDLFLPHRPCCERAAGKRGRALSGNEEIMSTERFAEIIEGLCRIYGLDHTRVLQGDSLDIGGVRIALRHGGGPLWSPMMMYCDFGPVPKELETRVYRQLLESNLSTYTGQGETFCLTPEGRVVFVNNYLLETLTPEILAGYLSLASIYAKRWREDYFLPEGEGKAKKTCANTLAGLHRRPAASDPKS
jgi:hypothetical protein